MYDMSGQRRIASGTLWSPELGDRVIRTYSKRFAVAVVFRRSTRGAGIGALHHIDC